MSPTLQGTHYKTVITEAQRIAIQLADSDDWNKESGTDETEGIVYSKHTKTYGKIFKLVVRKCCIQASSMCGGFTGVYCNLSSEEVSLATN